MHTITPQLRPTDRPTSRPEDRPAPIVYDRTGTGAPVVLLHGLGHRRQTWRPVMRALAGRYDLIAPDLPGCGESAAPPLGAPYGVRALVDAVRRLCDDLGLERPHLVGNSLGGAVALELAAQGAASSVTVFSPAGFTDRATRTALHALASGARIAGLVPEPVRVAAATSAAGRAIARRVLRGDLNTAASRHLAFDATVVSADSPFVRMVPHVARYRFSASVPCPVTIAWGARDRLLPPTGAARALRLLPHARLVSLLGCGHIPMADAPLRVAAEIAHTAG